MKKGFTLLELLAVIVVLAIIALIVTPFVTNAIKEAREGSAKNSAYGIVSAAAELYYGENLSKNGGVFNKEEISWTNGSINNSSTFTFKGDKPRNGSLTIDENGVVEISLNIGNYECSGGNKVSIRCYEKGIYKTGTKDEASIIYFNPVSNTKCNAGSENCMKWYAIENSDNTKNTVDVILDHNTSNGIKWNSDNVNTTMKEVATQLDTDTSTWHEDVKGTARLIKANEVADIVGARGSDSTKAEKFDVATTTYDKWFYLDGADGTNTNWQTQVAKGRDTSKYAWLYSNLYNCEQYGCDKQTTISSGNYGYWTQDAISGSSGYVWYVRFYGYLDYGSASSLHSGIRPAITIQKNVLK